MEKPTANNAQPIEILGQVDIKKSKIHFLYSSLRIRWPGYPLIGILLIVSYLVGHLVDGRNRFFVERDPDLSYPFIVDTVPSWSLAFIGGIGPATIILITQILILRSKNKKYFDKQVKDIHLAMVVLGEVLAVTYLLTNIIKCFVGRLRPDFYAYCNYKGYRTALDSGNMTHYFDTTFPGQIGNFKYCLDDNIDAHLSFPSGHSSISFCGLTFLMLFLLNAISKINFRHAGIGMAVRFFIVLVPLFSGALVAATRVIDYKHNVDDTIWGSFIGMLGAVLAFYANYGKRRPITAGIPVFGGEIEVDMMVLAEYREAVKKQNYVATPV